MTLTTDRLLLRPFLESDAAALFDFSRDPRVGYAAGWKPHKTEADSLRAIRTLFASPETFAIIEKESGTLIGSVGLHKSGQAAAERELGYALHPDWWGKGIVPEAAGAVLNYGFTALRLTSVWCSYYEENHRSRRVLEKLGFRPMFHETVLDELGEHTVYFTLLFREDWG